MHLKIINGAEIKRRHDRQTPKIVGIQRQYPKLYSWSSRKMRKDKDRALTIEENPGRDDSQ